MARQIGREEYDKGFEGETAKEAVKHALDIRKFEIELYWKRATYFWTFIAASLAAYALVQRAPDPEKSDLSVTLSSLGLVFAFAWYCANRGSKQWQENWENHVDLLEDKSVGHLYKVVVSRLEPIDPRDKKTRWLIGPGAFSVTKINQILSVYVTTLFFVLLIYSLLPLHLSRPINWMYVAEVLVAGVTIKAIHKYARTSSSDHKWKAILREPKLEEPPTKQA